MPLAHRVIPVVLHRSHQVVKGERFNAWRSVGHVMQAIRTYQQRGVDELVLLDIAATPEGRGPDLKMVEDLARECFMPLTVGGGVRSVDDVRDLLAAGADKVAIGAGWRESPLFLRQAADRFGSQAIICLFDIKDDALWNGGRPMPLDDYDWPRWLQMVQNCGAGEVVLTAVGREGTMQGYDLDLIRAVSAAVDIPVIANGGCSGYADMLAAIKAGASAVAAGALFQFTDATPRGAAEYLQQHGIEARV